MSSELSPARALELIEGLTKSEAWSYIRSIMDDEIRVATYQLANTPNMSHDERSYRLGAIWAAQKLLNLPDLLRSNILSDLAIKQAQAKNGSTNQQLRPSPLH